MPRNLIFLGNTVQHNRFHLPGTWVTEGEPKWQVISRILLCIRARHLNVSVHCAEPGPSPDGTAPHAPHAAVQRDCGDHVDPTKPIFANVTHV
ncbi:hypothetical protein K438DRAFT_1170918 [Mycena galopus ATCC 62051]|nr:hypothetical protein K438DRAFT_1170918 [Mycena galopus ATCC 62051]